MKIFILFSLMCIMFFDLNLAKCQESSKLNKAIENIQKTLGKDREYATWIIKIIDEFSTSLQVNIEDIANSQDEYYRKKERINFIIQRFFVSSSSSVEVSTLRLPSSIQSYDIYTYLNRLAKLNTRYNRIELIFDPDYLGIGTFERGKLNGTFEISITMWQIFHGWIDGRLSYEDATRKKFRLIFYVDENNHLKPNGIKVDEILVAETIDLKNYEPKIR